MRRVLVVLGLLAALTLVCASVFWLSEDDDRPPPAPAAAPAPHVPTPKPRAAPPAPDPKSSARAAAEPAPAATPPIRLARGRLECSVQTRDKNASVKSCRLTVSFPTGEQIATQLIDGRRDAVFEGLPHGVPLVLTVAAPGFLTGLCCDVTIPDGKWVRKEIDLAPAPIVRFTVVESFKKRRLGGVFVELRQGDLVVADGVTDGSGELTLLVPAVGQFRARLSLERMPTPPDAVIDVWPGEGVIESELEMRDGAVVEFAVVTPTGDPARGVTVWLVGDSNTAPSVRTDARGIATFNGVGPQLKLAAVARAGDGSVAWAAVQTASSGPSARTPLLLAAPAPLVGDVVDEGGSAIFGAQVEVVVRPFTEPIACRSDETGRFATPALPAGLAQVVVRRAGFLDWRSEETVEIRPTVGGRVRARLRRAPTGAVVVTVRDEARAPIAGATVTLYPSRLSATTAADGTCRIDGLQAGVEETALARRPGFRAGRFTTANSPGVRPQADVAVEMELVLIPTSGPPSAPGPGSVTGVVLDPSDAPVAAAQVKSGPIVRFTGPDGRFRLDGLVQGKPGEPIEIQVTPGAGLLQPFRCFVDFAAGETADLGTFRLRARPFARIELPPPLPPLPAAKSNSKRRSTSGTTSPVAAFWLSYNHPDELLGRRVGRFEPVACVSYDGKWLHLPPADDWVRDGRGEAFVAGPTPRGLLVGAAPWTLAPDAAPTLRPSLGTTSGAVVLDIPRSCDGGTASFRQTACAALFDPRSIHVPTGDDQPPVDPFAGLAGRRTFSIEGARSGMTVEDLAPGRWVVDVQAAGKETVSGAADVPGEAVMRFKFVRR